ncbi:aquaporin [Cellulomonas edaphi]|uniref:Aquaporin n=1 Tax=Cellulomonas edaphi TaxID=3053468 RepID=A0ABT7S8J9_9CELL|nr:aquaporin [Cellulomons edaphi]MDM7831925.1 aquaporin [Cellulomons edaphi]
MSQTPDPVAGSPEPADVTAAAAADDTTQPPVPAGEPVDTTKPAAASGPAATAAPAPEADASVESYDAYVVPAGTAVITGPSLAARLGAEAFGTFFLVLAGVGVAVWAGIQGLGAGPLGVALAFGIAVLAGASAVGHVSGGHFNPAVTIGAAIAGRTPWRDVLPYWLAQLVGGALATSVIFLSASSLKPIENNEREFFSSTSNGYDSHSPIFAAAQGGFSWVFAGLTELIVTAVFVGIILGVTDRRVTKVAAPVAIGLALTVLILVAMPVTNASLNPARSTATAIFSESWALKQLWLFWLFPILGAALAGLVYRAFAAEPPADNLLQEDDVYITEEDVLVVEER